MGRDGNKNEYLAEGTWLMGEPHMNRFQAIYDIAEVCSLKGIQHAVLSPGSRCAPLTLAFARHPKINTKTISDERSAGFIGLGLSQQTQHPTVLVCTSGTAAYNFAPSVAEAFFSHTPLIIFTADRPSEWIAQHDGQTIYQQEVFGKHVKRSYQLPQEYDHPDSTWAINRIVNEAINLSQQHPRGPVHINAPFREPLYPSAQEDIRFSKDVRVIESLTPSFSLTDDVKEILRKEWVGYNKVLIVVGQHDYSASLITLTKSVSEKHNLPVVGDILSNLHPLENLIRHGDLYLGQATEEIKKSLKPDLLITMGGSVIAKNLKVFLREHPSTAHWHIQPSGIPADTFQHLTKVIPTDAITFMGFLNSLTPSQTFEAQKQTNFKNLWEVEERRATRILDAYFPREEFGELELVDTIIRNLPESCNLHLANSMSVRYASFIGLASHQKNVKVYANRGTSGIDGCTSSAVGHCLVSTVPNILITGDMAFFYDRNAFWNTYPIPDLRIVVLNNHGGIIFKMIDGPSALAESDEYFVTRQNLNAKKLCEEFGFDYLKLDSRKKIKNSIKNFFDFDGTTKILELESGIQENKLIFEKLKEQLKQRYEL
jgi:2-succinyl-5-enolpyruvyl-6-hydroxy-3-cyclohexene-1-carboxylate synthase